MHRTLGDFLTDLFQNSVEAGAQRVTVELDRSDKEFILRVVDNGCGMTPEELRKAQDPFYTDGVKHPHRKVGLGLPLLIQTTELTGGRFEIASEKGRGTSVEAAFPLENVDTPPEGDWAGTLSQLMALPGTFEADVRRSTPAGSYQIRRSELQEALGSLEDLEALGLLKDFFLSAEADL